MVNNVHNSQPPKIRNQYQHFHQGYYEPCNKEKYVGNLSKIIYRSSWERYFMGLCDRNNKIIKWSSEPFSIDYISPIDKRTHKYFIDFWIMVKNQEEIKKYLVEIKPYNQTIIPTPPKRRTEKTLNRYINESKTFLINQAKWQTINEFCRHNKNTYFIILTEKNLTSFLK